MDQTEAVDGRHCPDEENRLPGLEAELFFFGVGYYEQL